MDNKQEIEMIRCLIANYGSYLDDKTAGYNNHDLCKALMKAVKSLEAWDKVKKEMLSQSIIKTHTENYESGFSDGLERAFDIIQDIIEEYLGEE